MFGDRYIGGERIWREEWIKKEKGVLWEVIEMFINLIMAKVSQVYEYT